jgi:hypothetical protein
MKKIAATMLALTLVAAFGAPAWAADSNGAADSCMWFDIRDDSAGGAQDIDAPGEPYTFENDSGDAACNGGGAGDAQILRIMPDCANDLHLGAGWPNYDGDNDASTGSAHLYMDVNDDPSGADDIISSIGIDLAASDPTPGAGGSYVSFVYAFAGDALTAFDNPSTESGSDPGASDGASPLGWEGAKAVHVPVIGGPAYDVGDGLVPTARYQIGVVDVVAGPRGTVSPTYTADSRFNVHIKPNNLLITRTFNGAGDDEELVNMGYDNGSPSCDCEEPSVSGSSEGAMSTLPDLLVQVQMKGDGNGSGTITAQDVTGCVNCFKDTLNQDQSGAISQEQMYLHDNNGSATVTAQDVLGFKALVSGTGGC